MDCARRVQWWRFTSTTSRATLRTRSGSKDLPDQVRLVARVLGDARAPLTEQQVASKFTGRGPWKMRLPQLLETLVSLGRARRVAGGVIAADLSLGTAGVKSAFTLCRAAHPYAAAFCPLRLARQARAAPAMRQFLRGIAPR